LNQKAAKKIGNINKPEISESLPVINPGYEYFNTWSLIIKVKSPMINNFDVSRL